MPRASWGSPIDKLSTIPEKEEVIPAIVPAEPVKKVEQKIDNRDDSPKILVTHEDAYIHERMKHQPQSLEEVDVRVEEKFQPGVHRLSLGSEFDEYKKKYTFRWINKTKRGIDEACDLKGWVLANRTFFPDLPNHLFGVNGSVERGTNILAFMPNERAQVLRDRPGQLSREKIKSTLDKHKDDPYFYTPKGEEKEDGVIQGI